MRDIFGRGKDIHLINWRISFRPHLCNGATDNRIQSASGNDHRECRSHVPSTHDYATTPCKDGRDSLKSGYPSATTTVRGRGHIVLGEVCYGNALGTFSFDLILSPSTATVRAETPEEWVSILSRVHGGFGSFLPVGIRIGEDAMSGSTPNRASCRCCFIKARARRVRAPPTA